MTMTVASGTSTPTSMTVVATSTSIAPERNRSMADSFSDPLSWPCRRPEAKVVERSFAQPLVLRDRRRRLHPVRSLDERADDEGSVPRGDLGAHAAEGLLGAELAARPAGLDGDAPGRQLVQHRHVEVAEEHHRRGPRDGRRGHHEHVGIRARLAFDGALLAQRGALLHAEAVLLVDDDDPEGAEAHVVGEQGVRADDEVHRPARESLERRGDGPRPSPAR